MKTIVAIFILFLGGCAAQQPQYQSFCIEADGKFYDVKAPRVQMYSNGRVRADRGPGSNAIMQVRFEEYARAHKSVCADVNPIQLGLKIPSIE